MIDNTELSWYEKTLWCAYQAKDCNDCQFSVCYKDDKGVVEREMRDMMIRWAYHHKGVKSSAIAKQFHLSTRRVQDITSRHPRDYNGAI